MSILKRALVAGLFICTATFQAWAYQPHYLDSRFNNDCKDGNAGDIRGSFTIKNITEKLVQLDLQNAIDPDYNFRLVADKKVLQPGEEATLHFIGSIRRDGKYQVLADIGLLIGDNFRASHTLDLYFLVTRGRFQLSSYEELFLQPDVIDKVQGNSFFSSEDKGQLQRSSKYKRVMPSVDQMLKMDPRSIYRIPLDSAGPGNCDPNFCGNFKRLETFKESDIRYAEKKVSASATVLARGEFSYRGMDNSLHPAFGWRVRAWQRGFGGIWSIAAEDWVQWNGLWQLNIPVTSGETQFQYVAFNRFFTPQSSAGDTYRWVGPVRTNISSSHNEGSWFADTSAGNARGLGEIYDEGMVLWSKLYWEGEINPLRGSSIRVFFPNTTYDCGNGSGNPWSCAARDGRIWLIPAHASRNGVMQHELAHQINYQYWNNTLPSGSGGSHNLTDCYNPGLAVVEGFANFMVFWTQAGRTADPNSGFDFRVEDPSFACDDPLNRNESWVAANFWDLHDQRGDGSDILWFIHPGATPAIFLREGMKNGMADFHPVYRSRANSNHRTIIDDIFRQNNTIN